MPTKDEIIERLFEIIDMVAGTGFFTQKELSELDILESMYYIIKLAESEEE